MADLGSTLVLVWWGILLVCWGVVLIDVLKNGGGLNFLLCLIIPFYALYWLFFRQTIYRGPVVGLISLNLILTGVLAMGWVSGKNHPCKLITEADVEEVLKQDVDGGKSSDTRTGPSCTYTTVAEPKMALVIIVTEDAQIKSKTDQDLPSGAFKVSNLGDDALSAGPTLMVQQGTVVFLVSWASPEASRSSLSGEQAADAAYSTLEGRKKLARLAMERYKP